MSLTENNVNAVEQQLYSDQEYKIVYMQAFIKADYYITVNMNKSNSSHTHGGG